MHFFLKPLLDEINVNIVQNPCLEIILLQKTWLLNADVSLDSTQQEIIYLMQVSTAVIRELCPIFQY